MRYAQFDLTIEATDGREGVLVTTVFAREGAPPKETHNVFRVGDGTSATFDSSDDAHAHIEKTFGEGYTLWQEALTEEFPDGRRLVVREGYDAAGDERGKQWVVTSPFGDRAVYSSEADYVRSLLVE